MQVNKVGYQPNFQAKFIKNEDLMEVTNNEVKTNNYSKLDKALTELEKTHRNVVMELTKNGDHITVTNLYNGKSLSWLSAPGHNSRQILSLSDPFSENYYRIFNSHKDMSTNSKLANQKINEIANRFYVPTSPDYTLGRKLDGIG